MAGVANSCDSRTRIKADANVHSEGSSAILGSIGSFGRGANTRKKKFTAPTCYCGTYAILFESSTADNPNRLFFGCSYFKAKGSHCKFFAWLDEYVTSFHAKDVTSCNELVEQMKRLEEKLECMEMLLAKDRTGIKSHSTKCKTISTLLLGIVVSLLFSALFSALSA